MSFFKNSGRFILQKRKFWLPVLLAFLLFLLLDALFPFYFRVSYSQVIVDQNGKMMYGFLSQDQKWRFKTELSHISPDLKKAFLEKEDKYFYYHFGINPVAIVRAFGLNVFSQKRLSGASTITMQVARLLEPKKRSYWNKLLEAGRALQLEWHYSKDQILELYFNLVPYGSNLEGIKTASLLYFGANPDQLSLAQITDLTIIPNRPTSLGLGKNNALIKEERVRWLKKFQENAVFEPKAIEDALSEDVKIYRRSLPKFALHLAHFLHQKQSHLPQIHTTISLDIQSKVEKIAAEYIQQFRPYNIHNAAVLVVRNSDRSVAAYLGSPDFSDNAHAGQVDGVQAYRSPGSALKPVVYGLAFEKGVGTPKSVISDVEVDFGGYRPENFDKRFNGLITFEKALAHSLNVPAVKILEKIGTSQLIDLLKKAQFLDIQKNEKKLGLSLSLGGCGVNLWEMAGLYASFANGGIFEPLKIYKNNKEKTAQSQKLFGQESNFMIAQILTQIQRPEMPNDYLHNPKLPKIAWKTGTSYGRRDAWSIGFNKNYTIAVWLGNFDGTPSPELVGANAATPLLFRLFNIIDYSPNLDWFETPKSLPSRQVCAESGLVPEEFCQNTTTDFYIPSVSPFQKCSHLKYVFVSENEKMSYCANCLPKNYKKKLYPDLSPEIIAFYEQNQAVFQKIPPHNPSCYQIVENEAPRIVSPINERKYLTIDQTGVELLLACQTKANVKKVFWYVNGHFYKESAASEKLFFRPLKGKNTVACADEYGQKSEIWFMVD